MKFVQTFWTSPPVRQSGEDPLALKAGWHTSEYHWMSWAMSCLQLRKLYGQVELVTDELGKSILIDTLGLPYTSVSLALEEEGKHFHPKLFSLAKIKTYSLQQEPFIHVDGDLFLYQYFPEHIYKSGLISSNPEADLFFNQEILRAVTDNGFELPQHLKGALAEPHLFSSNAGIIGGYDLDFIQRYCQQAFDFARVNKNLLDSVDTGSLNFLMEQMSFFYLARQEGRPIAYVAEQPVTDPLYHDFIRVADIPKVPMVHAVAGCKRFPFMLNHLAKRLRLDWPEYYYKILQLCTERKIDLSNNFYVHHPLQWSTDKEQISFSATPAKTSEKSPKPIESVFERTIKVIQYHQPERALPATREAFRALLDEQDLSEQCRDILQLELLIDSCQASLIPGKETKKLYEEDKVQYSRTHQLFNESALVDESVVVAKSASTLVHNAGWNWWKSDDNDMQQALSHNFETAPEKLPVAIVPDPLTLQAFVHYLDDLDAYVLDLLNESSYSIHEILDTVRQAFDEEIDPATNVAYRQLIFDTLKRLSFNGIVTVSGV